MISHRDLETVPNRASATAIEADPTHQPQG
jgi:hypothetical protein